MPLGFLSENRPNVPSPVVIIVPTGYPVPVSGVYQSSEGQEQRFDAGTRATANLEGNPTRWSYLRQ